MASKTFILLLLCAQYFALNYVAMATSAYVNQADIPPSPPRELVFASVEPKVDVKAEFTLQMEGVNITNVTIWHDMYANGTSTVTSGGVGYDFVSVAFDVPKGVPEYGAFVYVYSDDFPTQPDDAEKRLRRSKSEFNPRNEEVNFVMASRFNVKDEDRRENFTLQFKDGDTTLQECWGSSHWMNGNGTTNIYGGIEENYFEVVSHIPAGIYGESVYQCRPIHGESSSKRRTVELPSEEDDKMVHHYQFYGTILPELPFEEMYYVNSSSKIVAIDGNVVWKSDVVGAIEVTGGVGSNYFEVTKPEGEGAYGFFQYNVTSES